MPLRAVTEIKLRKEIKIKMPLRAVMRKITLRRMSEKNCH